MSTFEKLENLYYMQQYDAKATLKLCFNVIFHYVLFVLLQYLHVQLFQITYFAL